MMDDALYGMYDEGMFIMQVYGDGCAHGHGQWTWGRNRTPGNIVGPGLRHDTHAFLQ